MKKNLIGYILAGFFLLSLSILAQNDTYPTKKIKGIEYYVYKVQTSEGIYTIGKKFGVSQSDIKKANPEVENGINPGQELIIPVTKKNIYKTEKANTVQVEFIQHKVTKRQTLFAICRKYNVSQEDIKKYNPQLENGLHEGDILRIPKDSNESKNKYADNPISIHAITPAKSLPTVKDKTYKIHKVQPKETLYSISRTYQVSVDELSILNPESVSQLIVGTELKIPTHLNEKKTIDTQKKPINNNSETDINFEKLFGKTNPAGLNSSKKSIRIAFLLPFLLDNGRTDPTVEKFVDFYAGSLIAIKEAKDRGISMDVFTYDIEKSEQKVQDVLTNPELKTMDFIVGPAYSNQVSFVCDFAKENKINTLIPFTSKVPDVDFNPYLFQFNPGADAELKFATELFTGKFKNTHIIFAEIPNISASDEGNIWAENLKKELAKKHKTFYSFKMTNPDYADFESILNSREKNLIIFNTDKFANVSPFLTSLRALQAQYDVVFYEQYSWLDQEPKKPQSIYLAPFRPQLDNLSLKEYNASFSSFFNWNTATDNPRYDLLGYDLSSYFIALLQSYGSKFNNEIDNFSYTKGIQSQIQFERISKKSGYVNQQLYLGENKSE